MIGLKYKDGIVIAYNNVLNQHGMHLFDNVDRHYLINDRTVFSMPGLTKGSSGEFSDFQQICTKLDSLHRTDRVNYGKHTYTPENYGRYICTYV